MKQAEHVTDYGALEQRRRAAIVESLASGEAGAESLADVAHEARNLATALGLYCDLLEEPGVLSASHLHYGGELRLLATASRRLVEKLTPARAADGRPAMRKPIVPALWRGEGLDSEPARSLDPLPAQAVRPSGLRLAGRWGMMPAPLIENLADELVANRNLLAALAGPSIALTVAVEGGRRAVRLTGEDLTRVLVNLVKNAAEAMPGGGRIALSLSESAAEPCRLCLTVEDTGPGIPTGAFEEIFASGYTTRSRAVPLSPGWPASHRGVGLSISRSIVETAGGKIFASSGSSGGARFEIGLPVREV